MSKTLINPAGNASHWEPKFPFDLVVAYEDTSTRNRAIHLYDHLAQQLIDDYDFQCTWWKMDLLVNRTLLEQAADATAEANMIIVAVRAGSELPRIAREWIDAWTPRKDTRKSALVALIGGLGQESHDSAIQTQLEKIAHQTHMDFFAHEFELTDTGVTTASQQTGRPGQTSAPPLQHGPRPPLPLPRWGINE